MTSRSLKFVLFALLLGVSLSFGVSSLDRHPVDHSATSTVAIKFPKRPTGAEEQKRAAEAIEVATKAPPRKPQAVA